MKAEAKRLIRITGLISVALAGLIAVQVLLLEQTYNQKLSLFRQTAKTALLGIVEKLESLETLQRMMNIELKPGKDGSPGRSGLSIEKLTEQQRDIGSNPIPQNPYLLALINKVLAQYFGLEKRSMAERIPLSDLDGMVRAMLRDLKVETAVVYGILRTDTGEFIRAVPAGFDDRLRASDLRASLYPHDLNPEPYDLALYFPGQKKAVLAGMALPAAAAFCFLLITIGCFAFTLSSLVNLRKFSIRLTEFINAMAHAFKTPLSTLSLAGSALSHEDVRADDKQLAYCGQIVLEESGRLRRQTERILEMAVLEKKDIGLARRPVNIHDLLTRAVERFLPEAEKRGGTIRLVRGVSDAVLDVDELHWQGVLDNLLDNALRYNRRPPEILVETSGTESALRIIVRDNGIGIPVRDLSHIFDKYFRVASGLGQETPGFGLGLSYVRWVVESHGGAVRARSRVNEGSEFELLLPIRRGPLRKGRRLRRIFRP